MDPTDRYRAELSELYLSLRGGGLMISPLDEERLRGWEARGVPLPLALRALREAHGAWLGSGPGPRRRPFALRSAESFVDGLLREARLRSGGLAPEEAPPGANVGMAASDRLAAATYGLKERAASATGAASAAYLAAARALAGASPTDDPWEVAALAQGLAYLQALPRPAQRAVVRGAIVGAGARRGVPPAIHRETLRAFLCEAARAHGLLLRPSELP